MEVKQEMEDDVVELSSNKVQRCKTRQGTAVQKRAREKDEEEIDLKLIKVNAEIRQAGLEAKRATLALERLRLKRPRLL